MRTDDPDIEVKQFCKSRGINRATLRDAIAAAEQAHAVYQQALDIIERITGESPNDLDLAGLLADPDETTDSRLTAVLDRMVDLHYLAQSPEDYEADAFDATFDAAIEQRLERSAPWAGE